MPNNVNCLLIGAGNMAKEYCRVLKKLNIDTLVISRGEEKARMLGNYFGIKAISGGINRAKELIDLSSYDMAIVATNVQSLKHVVLQLIDEGISKILIEKPGCFYGEIDDLVKTANERKSRLYVAYNRRFYSSVHKLRECIKKDGGLKSFSFDFTEWGHKIAELNKSQKELEEWLLLNSSHVIDLAFYLGGYPAEMTTYTGGESKWHAGTSIFVGAGISEKGIPFSYHSNWESAGRWGVECFTDKGKYYLRPLETLKFQNKGELSAHDVIIDDIKDREFKAGMYEMVYAFVNNESDERLVSIIDQKKHIEVFKQIDGRLQK